MERKNNIIDTKENSKKNFSKAELEKYDYYKDQLNCSDKECYALIKEDRAIKRIEKTYNALTTMLKVQVVITLSLLTFAFIYDAFPSGNIKYNHKEVSISKEIEQNTKIN